MVAIACLLPVACSEREPGAAVVAAEPCGADGKLVTEIFGVLRASIRWQADALECEGMRRPNGEGARLRFEGPAGDRQLAFILGLPDLDEGQPGRELPTNVTLMEEGTGRFFGTRDTSSCWTDVTEHERLRAARYRISGTVYCLSPLAELNGRANVSFTELEFSGRLDWDEPE